MSKAKVIIVGGGISGIKAAVELGKANIDYVILEAKSRLGGRLNTVQGDNYKYDLGASWFHETLNNELFDEENEIALEQNQDLKHFYDDSPVKIINSEGPIPGSMKLGPIREEIHRYAEIWSQSNLDHSSDESFYDTVIRYLKEKSHLLSDEQISNGFQYVRSLELWHGIDIRSLSSKYSAIENEGRDAYAQHYDEVLQRHIDLLNPENVKLSTVVKSIKKIRNGTKQTVEITTNTNEVFIGDYTIVTVPQSILQIKDPLEKAHIKFEPVLPERIASSLDNIHFGALGKVIFEFDEVFWPTDSERILVLANCTKDFVRSIRSKDESVPQQFVSDFNNSDPKLWEFPVLFLNLATTLQKPTLIALIQSPITDYFEAQPSKTWDFFRPLIEHIAQKPEIPVPRNQILTEWTIDPFQKGSYSACYPGDDPLAAILALEEGFGVVRFAGEHTILEGAGCVHGAWNSGKREAKYIIESMNI